MPRCFLHWTEPAPAGGEDTLRLMSWRRHVTFRGSAFQAFEAEVLPLLDGTRTVPEICEAVSHSFETDDVLACLETLAAQGLVIEATDDTVTDRAPHHDWLNENAPAGQVAQEAIASAHVVIVGLGGCAPSATRALMASGTGEITLFDPSLVHAGDPFFSALYRLDDVGKPRAEVLTATLATLPGDTTLTPISTRPETVDALAETIASANLVLCCLDSGELACAHMLNIACRSRQVPWIAASLEGTEVVVGPGFFDFDGGPCFQCWRLREMATAGNLASRYAAEAHLMAQAADLSDRRENLAPAADIAGGMLAAEALSWLSGASLPNLDGRFITLGVPGLQMEKHVVLRKPGCPVCGTAA